MAEIPTDDRVAIVFSVSGDGTNMHSGVNNDAPETFQV